MHVRIHSTSSKRAAPRTAPLREHQTTRGVRPRLGALLPRNADVKCPSVQRFNPPPRKRIQASLERGEKNGKKSWSESARVPNIRMPAACRGIVRFGRVATYTERPESVLPRRAGGTCERLLHWIMQMVAGNKID